MRTLVVGDVHGCALELRHLVALAQPDRVVMVGDLFTKGPDPVGVWECIRDGGYEAVRGNHDERLLRIASGQSLGDRPGRACLSALRRADTAVVPWLRQLPLFHKVHGWMVVHAGMDPSGKRKRTTQRMALNMRTFPPSNPQAPLWHQQYHGTRRVIFGHDARRGLVRVEREGAPHLIGLDTGCVYGGSLSGYLIQEDRIYQVPARRVYLAVGITEEAQLDASQPSASLTPGK